MMNIVEPVAASQNDALTESTPVSNKRKADAINDEANSDDNSDIKKENKELKRQVEYWKVS